jgi:hypothetical protein
MWEMDVGLARALGEVIGWTPGDGPAALVSALAASVPAGTTAKLEAVAAGRVPPGAEPAAVARRIVDDRLAGRPSPAWSCWPLTTVAAALVETAGLGPAPVAALRRIDDRAPAVDLHSVLLVGDVLCDPYFAAVVRGWGEAEHVGVWARRAEEGDGRWTYEAGNGRWSAPLRYRVLAPACDPDDVHALCAVSAAFSGAPPTPFAALWRPEVAVDAHTHATGGCAVREWRRAGPDAVWEGEATLTEHADWAAAAADMAERTGVPVR